MRLPAFPLSVPPRLQIDAEELTPEAACPLGVIGRELDHRELGIDHSEDDNPRWRAAWRGARSRSTRSSRLFHVSARAWRVAVEHPFARAPPCQGTPILKAAKGGRHRGPAGPHQVGKGLVSHRQGDLD